MPRSLRRPCRVPGCPGLTFDRFCEAHKERRHAAPGEQQRGTAAARGYGSRWRRHRAMYLRAHPLCEIRQHCDGDPATEVDHIEPVAAGGSLYSETNLQAACRACHAWKTGQERRGVYARRIKHLGAKNS